MPWPLTEAAGQLVFHRVKMPIRVTLKARWMSFVAPRSVSCGGLAGVLIFASAVCRAQTGSVSDNLLSLALANQSWIDLLLFGVLIAACLARFRRLPRLAAALSLVALVPVILLLIALGLPGDAAGRPGGEVGVTMSPGTFPGDLTIAHFVAWALLITALLLGARRRVDHGVAVVCATVGLALVVLEMTGLSGWPGGGSVAEVAGQPSPWGGVQQCAVGLTTIVWLWNLVRAGVGGIVRWRAYIAFCAIALPVLLVAGEAEAQRIGEGLSAPMFLLIGLSGALLMGFLLQRLALEQDRSRRLADDLSADRETVIHGLAVAPTPVVLFNDRGEVLAASDEWLRSTGAERNDPAALLQWLETARPHTEAGDIIATVEALAQFSGTLLFADRRDKVLRWEAVGARLFATGDSCVTALMVHDVTDSSGYGGEVELRGVELRSGGAEPEP